MDRRKLHRALLKPARLTLAAVAALTEEAFVLSLHAQPPPAENARQEAVTPAPTPTPTPATTATPWVQALPAVTPPAATPPKPAPAPTPSAPPKPLPSNDVPPAAIGKPAPPPKPLATPAPNGAAKPAATPLPPVNPKPSPPPAPAVAPSSPTPKPPVPHTPPATPAAGTAEEVKAKLLRERQRELDPGAGFEAAPMTPDEQRTYEDNERIYNKLRPEEKGVINQQARARIREETVDAYIKSGLDLNEDQREVFALRFRQERRRLEREIQERANRERDRRVPQIIEQLKREFSRLNGPRSTPAREEGQVSPPPAPTSASPAVSPSAATNDHLPQVKNRSSQA